MSVPSEGALVADRYRIEAAIGRGAMGAVFAVLDEKSHRRYALKWIAFDAGMGNAEQIEQWARREIKALQLLQHPAILQLFDHGTADDAYWVVTELLTGSDLLARVEATGVLSWRACAAIGAGLCSALAAAHVQGIVHRDIKPGNLFLCDDGRFVLLDFGIAKASEGARQDTMAKGANTVLAGTVSFLSPERVAGAPAGPPSDIFAAGGTLQWLLTHALPFPGATMLEVLRSIAAGKRKAIERDDVAPELRAEIDRMMDADPAARPRAEQLAPLFTKLAGGEAEVRSALIELATKTHPGAATAAGANPAALALDAAVTAASALQMPTIPAIAVDVANDPLHATSQTQVITNPVAGGHTQIVTPSTTQIVTAKGNTQIVTNLQTQATVATKTKLPSWIAIVIAGVVITAAALFGTLAFRRTQKPASPPTPVSVAPALAAPKGQDALPPPTAPENVNAPPVVEAPPVVDDRPGTVSLSFEHWVQLSVDGKALGRKEFTTRLTLAPGKHLLVAEHPRFGTRRFNVDLRPGRTTNLHIDLATP